MNGIIPLYKPRGVTSADCVYQLRKLLHEKKIGHTGTLDPDVDGVLVICVGQATKLVNWLLNSDKVYQGQITFGSATTTEDASGEVIARTKLRAPLSDESIQLGMQSLTGLIQQQPPMYSAVKVNGKRLYEYARAHQEVERPIRQVTIKQFDLLAASQFDAVQRQQTCEFLVRCSKGTYIRTLAVQLGQYFHLPAHMSRLTRTYGGGFKLQETWTLEQIKLQVAQDQVDFCLPLTAAFADQLPQYELTAAQWQVVQNGGAIQLPLTAEQVLLTWRQQVKAVYHLQDQNYVPQIMLLKNDR